MRAQSTQARLVGELVKRASNDANRDTQIGRTLFQLLVPVEMEAHLGGSSEMLLELDDGTAAIPWELLDAPEDGRGGASVPWAIRAKLLRKLRTVEFRQQVSDARIEDAVLVIGFMAVAVVHVHMKNGFFWTAGGYEYPLFWGLVCVAIAIRGVAERSDRAAMLGVPVGRVQTTVWVMTTVLAFVTVFLRSGVISVPIGSALGVAVLVRALAAARHARQGASA